MKYLLIITILLTYSFSAYAKQDTILGTITVKKKEKKRTLFDQANDRLILIDEKGKVINAGEISFDMVMEKDGKMIALSSRNNYLTHEMRDLLQVAQDGTIFYFKNIKLNKKNGEVENYPSTVVKVDAEFYMSRKRKHRD